MNGEPTSSLQKAAASTFEQLGFLYADDELSEDQAALPVDGVARVEFTGPLTGTLEVRLAGNLLGDLAMNMLGADEVPEPSVVMDAFGEVANVICGNVLPLVAGPEGVFDLKAPEVCEGAGVDLAPLPGDVARMSMGLEGGRADLAFTIRSQAAG